MQRPQVHANALIEVHGGDVVVRRHKPDAAAPGRSRLSEAALHQRSPNTSSVFAGADSNDLVLAVPDVDQNQPDAPTPQHGEVAR